MPILNIPHVSYILASYGITMLVIATLIIWIVMDGRAQRRILDQLDRQGNRRRSAEKPTTSQQAEGIATHDE